MKIYCKKCGKFVGIIEEGSQLRKGLVYLCGDCDYKLMPPPVRPTLKRDASSLSDLFGIFDEGIFKDMKFEDPWKK